VKVIVDIGHPAHVHFFKHFIWEMKKGGHEILITASKKEITLDLLEKLGFDYIFTCKRYGGVKFGYELIKRDIQMFNLARKFKPDLITGIHSTIAAHVSKITKAKSIIFTDTEHAKLANFVTFPFADVICTPTCFNKDLGKKQIRYNGYHELAYLHPNYFTPNPAVLDEMGLNKDDKFIILRFVSWAASHDIGHSGLNLEMKRKAVKEFSKYAKVFITSEAPLPNDLEKIPPERIHDAMYYATLLYGESATMASECSILGTPAIFLDNDGRGYTDEQEKVYGSVFNFTESIEDQAKSIKRGVNLLEKENIKEDWRQKRQKLLKDKIDVTKWMTDLIINYPDSIELIRSRS
jgi:predicted glycosyltransferase